MPLEHKLPRARCSTNRIDDRQGHPRETAVQTSALICRPGRRTSPALAFTAQRAGAQRARWRRWAPRSSPARARRPGRGAVSRKPTEPPRTDMPAALDICHAAPPAPRRRHRFLLEPVAMPLFVSRPQAALDERRGDARRHRSGDLATKSDPAPREYAPLIRRHPPFRRDTRTRPHAASEATALPPVTEVQRQRLKNYSAAQHAANMCARAWRSRAPTAIAMKEREGSARADQVATRVGGGQPSPSSTYCARTFGRRADAQAELAALPWRETAVNLLQPRSRAAVPCWRCSRPRLAQQERLCAQLRARWAQPPYQSTS